MEQIILDETTRTDRQKWAWTELNKARADDIYGIVHYTLEGYWPVTVRQVYYQLISSNMIKDDHWFNYGNPKQGRPKDMNQAVSTLLKWMRIDGRLAWGAINDEHRIAGEKPGWDDMETFLESIKEGVQEMSEDYQRCNAQNQENYIEVWLEKAALQHILKPTTNKYCKRLIINRGYSSVTFLNDYRKRAEQAVKAGRQPVVLYYGDWDPSGENMINASYQTLMNELNFKEAVFYRGAINPDQFHLINADPVVLKTEDKRSPKFVKKYGTRAFELDALHPQQLQEIVENDILGLTNMENLECEMALGEKEKQRLKRFPVIIGKMIKQFNSGPMVRTRY